MNIQPVGEGRSRNTGVEFVEQGKLESQGRDDRGRGGVEAPHDIARMPVLRVGPVIVLHPTSVGGGAACSVDSLGVTGDRMARVGDPVRGVGAGGAPLGGGICKESNHGDRLREAVNTSNGRNGQGDQPVMLTWLNSVPSSPLISRL